MQPQAIVENFRRTVTAHYFDTRGRAGRAEFWFYALAYLVLAIATGLISWILPLNALLGLVLLLPTASIGARRLQDAGRDGRLVWLLVVPALLIQFFTLLAWGPLGIVAFLAFYFTIGWMLYLVMLVAMVMLIYFWIQPGDPMPNAYGAPPAAPPGL